MNIYTHKFIATCPNNGKRINYTVEITVADDRKIMVEQIVTCAALCDGGYHEDIANKFYEQFGGNQVIRAHHHGVDIETRRGFDTPNVRLSERIVMGPRVWEKGAHLQTFVDSFRNK